MNVTSLANQTLVTLSRGIPPRVEKIRAAAVGRPAARTALMVAAQVAVLWSINRGASAAVTELHAPIPGNVVGLALLFALLCGGIVKASWLEPTASFLVKHFAFFFIPITIGLMGMGRLFVLHGIGILCTLAVSAAVGLALCGVTAQSLINAQTRTHVDANRSE